MKYKTKQSSHIPESAREKMGMTIGNILSSGLTECGNFSIKGDQSKISKLMKNQKQSKIISKAKRTARNLLNVANVDTAFTDSSADSKNPVVANINLIPKSKFYQNGNGMQGQFVLLRGGTIQ